MKKIALEVQPNEVLVDEKFDVRVSGLWPGQRVTIHAVVVETDMSFGACGCYVADRGGNIDVSSNPSTSGTYTGVDQMGLIWSMRQSPGQRPGLRLTKSDVSSPQVVNISVYNEHRRFEDLYESSLLSLATAKVFRWYIGKSVRRVAVQVGRVRGTLFVPEGTGPFPGVIDIFGSGGGLMEYRASLLATRGFVVLALAFFGYMDLPKTFHILDLNYFKEAAQFLQDHPKVQPRGIGVIAISKGAEIAQLLSLHCPLVRVLVTINGLPFISLLPVKNDGQDIKISKGMDYNEFIYTEKGIITLNSFPLDPHIMFKLWETDVKILSIASGDDKSISPHIHKLQYDNFPQDKKQNIELVVYHGAGHLLEPPYSPCCRSSFDKGTGMNLVWGGNPADHAYAQEDSWKKILDFLRKNLQYDLNKTHKKSRL